MAAAAVGRASRGATERGGANATREIDEGRG